jgi:hypothetical protein
MRIFDQTNKNNTTDLEKDFFTAMLCMFVVFSLIGSFLIHFNKKSGFIYIRNRNPEEEQLI